MPCGWNNAGQRFFLNVGIKRPHLVWRVPKGYVEQYYNPANFTPAMPQRPPGACRRAQCRTYSSGPRTALVPIHVYAANTPPLLTRARACDAPRNTVLDPSVSPIAWTAGMLNMGGP